MLSYKKWFWQNWVAFIMYIILLIVVFTGSIAMVFRFNMRLSLTAIALVLGGGLNFLTTIEYYLARDWMKEDMNYEGIKIAGFDITPDWKSILIQFAIPILVMILDVFLMAFAGKAVKVYMHWGDIFKMFIVYIISLIPVILFKRNKVMEMITLTEEEEEMYGIPKLFQQDESLNGM